MNLRYALVVVFIGLPLTLAAGQQTMVPPGDSPAQVSGAGAVGSPDFGDGKPGALKIFFTGFLLGYYRLPQSQSSDF